MINKTDLYVNPLLTSHSLAYVNEQYASEVILPVLPVKKDSGQIVSYNMDNLRIVNSLRAQGAHTNEINHTLSIADHYFLEEHALKELVTQSEIDQADAPIKPKEDAVENIMDRINVIKEKALADAMADTAILTQNTTLSSTSQWSDYNNSTPVEDLQTGSDAVRAATGKTPNTIILSYVVMSQLIHHPDIIARAQGAVVVDADVTKKIIMKVIPNIRRVIVANAQYNNSVKGGADTLAEIWGKHAWIGYIEDRPRLKSRTFGYTYQGKEHRLVDELPMNRSHETWSRKGTYVRVTDEYDQKLVDVECMYLVKNAVA